MYIGRHSDVVETEQGHARVPTGRNARAFVTDYATGIRYVDAYGVKVIKQAGTEYLKSYGHKGQTQSTPTNPKPRAAR